MAKIVEYTLGAKFDYFYTSTLASTSSLTEVLILSVLIPANSMTATGTNTVFRIDAGIRKTGTTNTATVKFYANTANNLTSALQLGTYSVASNVLTSMFNRFGAIANSSSTEFFTSTTSLSSDYQGIAGAGTTVNINWTVDQYIILAGNVVNGADSIGGFFLKVSN
jgi:hypothetical protein